MTWRPSQALRNFMMLHAPFRVAMSNCVLKIYTGAQPATAEAAPTGTLLCTFSNASGALTREVYATGTVTIAGSSGSINTITVAGIDVLGGAVNFTTDLTTTAAAIAAQINANPGNSMVVATSSGAIITLTMLPGFGAFTATVGGTQTTMTVTNVNIGSAQAGTSPVNCLQWAGTAANGVISKSGATWSGVAAASGTAGWFRIEASVADPGTLDSTDSIMRIDGACATSGAELNLGTTTIASGATQTITSFTVTLPSA